MNERKTPAIEVLGLAKSFDGVHAVASVDFTIFKKSVPTGRRNF